MPALSAIAIEGAKAVGKTATAARRAATVHALDRPGALELAAADPRRLLTGAQPVLIDEWQRFPPVWDLVRRAVDDDPSPGQFLLVGSASPRDPGTHSGAGRIVRLRMRPLTLTERAETEPAVSLAVLLEGRREPIAGSTRVSLEDYAREICASGFPGLRGLPERAVRAQLDSYLDLIVDRDFPEISHTVRNPETLRRWLSAYAAATGASDQRPSIISSTPPWPPDCLAPDPARSSRPGRRSPRSVVTPPCWGSCSSHSSHSTSASTPRQQKRGWDICARTRVSTRSTSSSSVPTPASSPWRSSSPTPPASAISAICIGSPISSETICWTRSSSPPAAR